MKVYKKMINRGYLTCTENTSAGYQNVKIESNRICTFVYQDETFIEKRICKCYENCQKIWYCNYFYLTNNNDFPIWNCEFSIILPKGICFVENSLFLNESNIQPSKKLGWFIGKIEPNSCISICFSTYNDLFRKNPSEISTLLCNYQINLPYGESVNRFRQSTIFLQNSL